MNPECSSALRRLRELVEAHGEGEATKRALDRLLRDLLPRTVGGEPYLVAGIVGPNNSGKSALFNGLTGRDLSPSLPTGGATRRLYGAGSGALIDRLAGDPTLERFPIVRASALDAEEVAQRASPAGDPGELLAFDADLPDGLLLIDTPDFDSVLAENRLASESLLAVADLAIAVVTRHTYQNREVVRFLERWLSHGRPWLLVYNEAPSPQLALEHGAKLAEDLGSEPLAIFCAPHDLGVQEGTAPLAPRAACGATGDVSLRDFLFDMERTGELKERALRASLAQLVDDVREWRGLLDGQADRARDLSAVVETHARTAAARIGACAMPGGPFIEAFRTVLDRRTNPISRRWRLGLRKVRLKLEALPSLIARRGQGQEKGARQSLADVERGEFARAWPELWEALVRDLGAEGRVAAREHASPAVTELLDRDLDEANRERRRATAMEAIDTSAVALDAFQDVSEVLVEDAIRDRGRDWDIQAAADVAMLAPIAIATAVIIKTGGLGSDVGVAGGAALSSYLFEKYSHLLGSRITNEAARRWAEQRTGELTPVLADALLPESGPRLRETESRNRRLIEELDALCAQLVP